MDLGRVDSTNLIELPMASGSGSSNPVAVGTIEEFGFKPIESMETPRTAESEEELRDRVHQEYCDIHLATKERESEIKRTVWAQNMTDMEEALEEDEKDWAENSKSVWVCNTSQNLSGKVKRRKKAVIKIEVDLPESESRSVSIQEAPIIRIPYQKPLPPRKHFMLVTSNIYTKDETSLHNYPYWGDRAVWTEKQFFEDLLEAYEGNRHGYEKPYVKFTKFFVETVIQMAGMEIRGEGPALTLTLVDPEALLNKHRQNQESTLVAGSDGSIDMIDFDLLSKVWWKMGSPKKFRKRFLWTFEKLKCEGDSDTARNPTPNNAWKDAKPFPKFLDRDPRFVKKMTLKWQSFHSKRDFNKTGPYIPCDHPGSCQDAKEACPCYSNGVYCEKLCQCSQDCIMRFIGCSCKGRCNRGICICFFASRECDPELCRCDAVKTEDEHSDCKNNGVQLNYRKKLIVAPSKFGWGCFAGEDASKNEFMGEYCGEIISEKEAERRGKIYDHRLDNHNYMFKINKNEDLDARRVGTLLRFCNHSTSYANIDPKIVMVKGVQRVLFYAKHSIEAGEELLFDYGLTFSQKLSVKDYPPKKLRESEVEHYLQETIMNYSLST